MVGKKTGSSWRDYTSAVFIVALRVNYMRASKRTSWSDSDGKNLLRAS
jgi:hypothetical protein